MSSSKLVHLKPTLWRSYKRAVRRFDKLAARYMAEGQSDPALLRRVERAQGALMDLAGRCQAIENAIEHSIDPSPVEMEIFLPAGEFGYIFED